MHESNHKLSKLWVDKSREICNTLMKSWLQDNDIEMHSTHNELKFVLAERFVRTLQNCRINSTNI